ncbi:hypothetical protein EJ08DRAFT_111604 [Tothia fuscella]|uniref:polynucleotide adenylyltransferase n=1 Tax=Tothia fuscella TaxID=1048955 RepID=A0A9P4NW23_9PEZI|nr:hypothetical protein EJ08DRAFT_111604 [Tothia fuscella]
MANSYRADQYRSSDSYSNRHDDGQYRGGRDSGRRSRTPPPRMYQFGGGGGDSYRPHEAGGQYNNNDAYQGQRPQDFSFRSQRQTQFPAAVPPAPRVQRNEANRGRGRGGRHARQNGNQRPYKQRWIPKSANTRDILYSNVDRQGTPERLEGMSGAPHAFKNMDDLSESDGEMDLETDEEGSGAESGPSLKRTRQNPAATDGNSVPKWSNPDPYTVLPPVEDVVKKKDVVQLIRKAKVTAEQEKQKRNDVADNVDFISFDMDESENETEDEAEAEGIEDDEDDLGERKSSSNGATNQRQVIAGSINDLPPRPAVSADVQFSHLSNHHNYLNANGSTSNPPSTVLPPRTGPRHDVWPPKTEEEAVKLTKAKGKLLGPPGFDLMPTNFKPQDKAPKHGKKRKQRQDGEIVPEWQSFGRDSATPWLTQDHSKTEHMGSWLHKEICDFYEFAKPRDFEAAVRNDLLDRIARALKRQFPSGDIRCFGSFAAGIYLPTADMDLVWVSRSYITTGQPEFQPTFGKMRKFMACLINNGIAHEDGREIISKAKVPIIKFVDTLTDLKVDISFENMTGVVAIDTFNGWKAQFPAMPVLVTMVKQFLLMRGLNEVFLGGVGGFSVTCLVTSLLQHMPAVQSGNMRPEENLGEVLLQFLDFYGNRLNMEKTGISMATPPGFFSKMESTSKWSIMDPNNSRNDIAVGSSAAPLIAKRFSEAHTVLRDHMALLRQTGNVLRQGQSILSPVFGGNYSSFIHQRDRLRYVYQDIPQQYR